jgi:hypothetical protein
MTALPQPANVSQNVPIASAAYFFASISLSPHPRRWLTISKQSEAEFTDHQFIKPL